MGQPPPRLDAFRCGCSGMCVFYCVFFRENERALSQLAIAGVWGVFPGLPSPIFWTSTPFQLFVIQLTLAYVVIDFFFVSAPSAAGLLSCRCFPRCC